MPRNFKEKLERPAAKQEQHGTPVVTRRPVISEQIRVDDFTWNEVDFRNTGKNCVVVGPVKGHQTRLTSRGAIMGFLNAMLDFDERYTVVEHGLHLTVNPADFLDLYSANDIGHVNFDVANRDKRSTSGKIIAGLEPREGYEENWYVLNIRHGKLKLGKTVAPIHSKDMPEETTVYDNQDNDEAWGRYFKQEGLELAMGVYKGVKKVTCALRPQNDGDVKSFQTKLNQFGMEADDRNTERGKTIRNKQAGRSNARTAAAVEKHEEVKEAALEAVTSVIVYHGDDKYEVAPEDLVGATLEAFKGTQRYGEEFCKTLANVLAAFRNAEMREANLAIVSLPAS